MGAQGEGSGSRMGRIRVLYERVSHFLREGLWAVDPSSFTVGRRRWLQVGRVITLTVRGFTEQRIQLRASALTFYSLMSLVPIAAMAFGIAKSFGLESHLYELIQRQLGAYPEVAEKIVEFSHALLMRTGGGLVAGVGVIMLFWSVIKVFSHIERAFNAIWHINRPRPFFRKFSDYLSMIIVTPIIIIVASSANVYLRTLLQQASTDPEALLLVKRWILILLQLAPYVLIPLMFALLYIVMPNTKVRFTSGLIAGLVSGVGFVGLQWAYLYFQFGVSKYNAIYGSFAAVPLFLVWMQLSWLIVLIGAEISYAVQNIRLYEHARETAHLSARRTKELSLLLLSTILTRFNRGEGPLTATQLAENHNLPILLTRRLLEWMVQAQILRTTPSETGREPSFIPSEPAERLTYGEVLKRHDQLGATIRAQGEQLDAISTIYEQEAIPQGLDYILDRLNREKRGAPPE